MKKESKYVAFSTQKGGVGKTTLTVLVASYLHYVKGFNVAMVDCDYPQYSIAEMRERDLKTVMEDEHYKLMAYQQFTTLGKKAYPVVSSTPEDAVQVASQLAETGEFDFIFFDLPGTVNNADVIRTLSQMDYIFSPVTADRVVLESTLRFAVYDVALGIIRAMFAVFSFDEIFSKEIFGAREITKASLETVSAILSSVSIITGG